MRIAAMVSMRVAASGPAARSRPGGLRILDDLLVRRAACTSADAQVVGQHDLVLAVGAVPALLDVEQPVELVLRIRAVHALPHFLYAQKGTRRNTKLSCTSSLTM